MNKPFVLALAIVGTAVAVDAIAIIKATNDVKKKTDALNARMDVYRRAKAERIRKMQEQEDYDIKFDLIMNINYN